MLNPMKSYNKLRDAMAELFWYNKNGLTIKEVRNWLNEKIGRFNYNIFFDRTEPGALNTMFYYTLEYKGEKFEFGLWIDNYSGLVDGYQLY